MKRAENKKRSGQVITLAIAATIAAAASSSLGNTYNYTGGEDDDWNVATNWTLSGGSSHAVPTATNDSAILGQVSGAGSANFNMTYASPGLVSLTINATNVATFTLNQVTAGTTMYAANEVLGSTTFGNNYNQTAGTNMVSGELDLGSSSQSASAGTYTLGGGALRVGGDELVGLSSQTLLGGSSFTQTAGSNTCDGVDLGSGNIGSNATGTYTFSGGTLNCEDIGAGGSGAASTFTQSGSAATTQTGSGIQLGGSGGGTGTYNLNGGTVTINTMFGNTGGITVGQGGAGVFSQTAGTVSFITSNGFIDVGAAGNGLYSLSGTGTISGADSEDIGEFGASGVGTFTQGAGTTNTLATSSTLTVGDSVTGTYNLSAGALSALNVNIGNHTGVGTFNQVAGTLTSSGVVTVGAKGSYNLTGAGSLTLSSTGSGVVLAVVGGGSVTQSAGTITDNTGEISIGDSDTSTASYSLSSTGQINAYTLYVGTNDSTNGSFTQSGGTIKVAYTEVIGNVGTGSFMQTGGSNSAVNFYVGTTGSGGTYSLGTATSTLTVTGGEYIGYVTTGTFTQTDGTNTVSGAGLDLGGFSGGGNGSYTLSGGTLSLSSTSEIIGDDGIGKFTQTDGTNFINFNSTFIVGNTANSTGNYFLKGGDLDVTIGSEYIGYSGTGTFTQSAGNNTLSNFIGGLTIGYNTGSIGTYNLSSTGTLTVTGSELVGSAGAGTFNQSGGTNNANGSGLTVGGGSVASSYTLSGGTATVTQLSVSSGSTFTWTTGILGIKSAATSMSATNMNSISVSSLTGIVPGAGHPNRSILVATAVTFGGHTNAWTGSFDLAANDMIVKNGSLSNITNQIAEGMGNGNPGLWITTAGLTSSAAAAVPSTTGLGVELNDNGFGTHTPLMTTFDGQTVGDADVLVKYTFLGDADLSGTLNANDYILIDTGFGTQNNAIPLTGWRNGDFNYDGTINGDDYTLIDNAFNTQGSISFAVTSAGPAEMIATDTAQISVPEPTAAALLSIASLGFLPRKRRRTT